MNIGAELSRLISRQSTFLLSLSFLLLFLPWTLYSATPVQQQLDSLIAAAQGKRIGMITNPSGCDEAGNLDATYVLNASGTTITAFFAPEHGLRGTAPAGQAGSDYVDSETGIPVYAVYGIRNAPTTAQLTNVDLVVFDMQDVGVRFYTFVWTMTHCMEAAARDGKPFYVIDRPNPIGGMRVEGAPNTGSSTLVGRIGTNTTFGVATRHGMTAGEIAWMWNQESMSPKVDLHVITVPNWNRSQWWPETGRVFVKPSPNMRTPDCTVIYPGTCIFEGSNVSEGRGTDKPFEKIGAPFINGTNWAANLNSNLFPGVRFDAITFTPTNSKFSGQLCGGVQVVALDRDTFDPIQTGLRMLQTAYQMHPANVTITSYAATLMGIPNLQTTLKTNSVDSIMAGWQSLLAQFRTLRRNYLLYPETPPLLQPIRMGAPGHAELRWSAVKGRSYRMNYRNDFSTPWNFFDDYVATGNFWAGMDALGTSNRFYRLELLP